MSENSNRSAEEERPGEAAINRGMWALLKDLLKELLTGPVLLAAGVGIVALGYFVGFAPLMSLGALLVLLGLGSIFVW